MWLMKTQAAGGTEMSGWGNYKKGCFIVLLSLYDHLEMFSLV